MYIYIYGHRYAYIYISIDMIYLHLHVAVSGAPGSAAHQRGPRPTHGRELEDGPGPHGAIHGAGWRWAGPENGQKWHQNLWENQGKPM